VAEVSCEYVFFRYCFSKYSFSAEVIGGIVS